MADLKDYRKILSVEPENNTTGWSVYHIVFEDAEGEVLNIGFPPKVDAPKPGDMIQIFKNKNGNLYTKPSTIIKAGDVKKTTEMSSAMDSIYNSDTYWKYKTWYEQNVRDKKIEFQFYFSEAIKLLTPLVPNTGKVPTKAVVESVEQLYFQAFIMVAKAIEQGHITLGDGKQEEGEKNEGQKEESKEEYHKVKVRGSESPKKQPKDEPKEEEDDDNEIPF